MCFLVRIFKQILAFFFEKCDFGAVQRSALCRFRQELSNAYFLAKLRFDTAENEPCRVCRIPSPCGSPGPLPSVVSRPSNQLKSTSWSSRSSPARRSQARVPRGARGPVRAASSAALHGAATLRSEPSTLASPSATLLAPPPTAPAADANDGDAGFMLWVF